jgi:hypothetical protein
MVQTYQHNAVIAANPQLHQGPPRMGGH